MSQVAFDTLKFTRRLKEVGVPERQAEAEAEAINDAFSEALNTRVATKEDIQKLKDDIQAFKDEVKKDTQGLKDEVTKLGARMDNLDTELTARINLVHWMIGFNLIMTTGILWKLFIPAA